jgi:hypothetical protein
MGFKRTIAGVAIGMLLLCRAAGAATPAEPLIVTAQTDPNLILLPAQTDLPERSLEAADSFGRAVAEAMQTQQRAIEQACRSTAAAHASGTNRWNWQANCSYQRR